MPKGWLKQCLYAKLQLVGSITAENDGALLAQLQPATMMNPFVEACRIPFEPGDVYIWIETERETEREKSVKRQQFDEMVDRQRHSCQCLAAAYSTASHPPALPSFGPLC